MMNDFSIRECRESCFFGGFALLGIGLSIVTAKLLADYLTAHQFGEYQLLGSYVGLLTIFSLSGYGVSIQKRIFANEDWYIGYFIFRVLPCSLLVLVIGGASFVVLSGDALLDTDLLFLALAVGVFRIFDHSAPILYAKLKFKEVRYLDLLSKLFWVITLVSVMSIEVGFTAILKLYVVYGIMFVLIKMVYAVRSLRSDLNWKIRAIDRLAFHSEGMRTTLVATVAIAATHIERLILGILNPSLLALFFIGQVIPSAVKDNGKIFLIPILNTWAKSGSSVNQQNVWKYRYRFFWFGVLMFFGTVLGAPLFIGLLFQDYVEAVYISQILSIPLIFKFLDLGMASSMALGTQTKAFNDINLWVNILKIILGLVLIPVYGINGAIVSVLVFELTRGALVYHRFTIARKHVAERGEMASNREP